MFAHHCAQLWFTRTYIYSGQVCSGISDYDEHWVHLGQSSVHGVLVCSCMETRQRIFKCTFILF